MTAFRRRYGPSALVCGASEGLGAEFAGQLAARGLDLVLVARRPAPLEALAAALSSRHRIAARTLPLDLGRADDLRALCEALAPLDVGLLVYCAARAPIGEFLDCEAAEHDSLVDVNCRAPARLARELGARMARQGHGGIIFLSSLAGLQGSAMVAHYAASKAYQRVLAEGLWNELRPRGVDVLACVAGPTDTPTYRATRPARPGRFELPPVQPAPAVVESALAALGKRPVCIPGAANRASHFLLRRLLPTSLAVRLVSASTRRMYR